MDRKYAQNVLNVPVHGGVADGAQAVREWYSTKHKYCGRISGDSASFTQVVWVASDQLGVGVAKSRLGDTYVVAHYYPPGNITGEERVNVINCNTDVQRKAAAVPVPVLEPVPEPELEPMIVDSKSTHSRQAL